LAYDDDDSSEVAWNQIKLNGVTKQNKQKILGEITILEQLEHENIMKIYDSWEAPNGHLIFITEIMSSGTLKEFTKDAKKVRLKTIKKWCKQILSGLEYLHNRETPIIHRDIKCDNIFLNGNHK
jgi:WNK lysine deficient protein kinase